MSKNDRRSKRTEAALLNALAELLKQKQLRKITINELVSLADLHRSTFYLHYRDIFDFYQQTENSFLAIYENVIKESATHDYSGVIESILTYVDENRAIASMFFGKNAEPSFRIQLTEYIERQYIKISAYEDNISKIPSEWDALAAYHAGGMMNLLASWVQSDYSIPKGKMITLFIELDNRVANLRRKTCKK